ncbi:phosphatidylglycerophosphatase C [Biostraticola tofi]|uniref:Phosphatidylglycerophosphatase C n=1 Tax=Biostraticola tofi TaxID=466109 RepID=A0A4R3YJG4_9GAMM|nr:phosphatidylglycerophosphatase C [Biostraticola tofi]TCV92212.1 phosphatidylglycerophosphatase C [Biostraticola tofi]
MSSSTAQRVVFFDLDGTLHQQDMFGTFLRFLLRHLPLNILLVLPLLPVIGIGLLVKGRNARWPMSLLLWAITFGHSETKLLALQEKFIVWFRLHVTGFPVVLQRLSDYLESHDAQVWLITGSPEPLVEGVYHDAVFLPQVKLIGSRMERRNGGWVLTLRCLGHEKVAQLERELGIPLKLYSGYSDSLHDSPLLYFCEHRWRVTPDGNLKPLD